MKTIITGDIHNYFGYLNDMINKQQPDLVISAGDFGFWPGRKWAEPFTNIKPQKSKILWIDGNHEDHWALRDRTTDEFVPNVIYMPRGSTYTLPDGRTILFMGGADSIDKMRRTEGDSWFREEIITQKDFHNLPDPSKVKIDIFVTHTCPSELVPTLRLQYPEKSYEPSNEALSQLWKMYNPKLWYLGHWHQEVTLVIDGTTFQVLSGLGCHGGGRWWKQLE